MLGIAAEYSMPFNWVPMAQEEQKKVDLIDKGLGDGTAIYKVGQKMVFVTFGEDPIENNVFLTTITNGYVKSLRVERGYYIPESFEIDRKTGLTKEISKEDERLLIERLVKDEQFSIKNSKERGEKPVTHRTEGSYFSSENGVVHKNPGPPIDPNIKRHMHLIR